MSIEQRLKDLEAFRRQVQSGMMPQRTALGPGSLQKSAIKSGSIDAKLLNVTTLESVSASTGDLSVTGTLTIGAAGDISVGNGGVIAMGSGSTIALGPGSTVTLASGGVLTVNGDITIGATGKLIWGDGSQHYIDNDLVHFDLPAGDARSTIEWRDGAASGYYSEVKARQVSSTDTNVFLYAYGANGPTGPWAFLTAQATATRIETAMQVHDASNVLADIRVVDTQGIVLRNNQAGPGDQSRIRNILGGTGGSEYFAVADSSDASLFSVGSDGSVESNLKSTTIRFQVKDSAGVSMFGITGTGQWLTKAFDAAGGAGAYVTRVPIAYDMGGTPKSGYLRIYAS